MYNNSYDLPSQRRQDSRGSARSHGSRGSRERSPDDFENLNDSSTVFTSSDVRKRIAAARIQWESEKNLAVQNALSSVHTLEHRLGEIDDTRDKVLQQYSDLRSRHSRLVAEHQSLKTQHELQQRRYIRQRADHLGPAQRARSGSGGRGARATPGERPAAMPAFPGVTSASKDSALSVAGLSADERARLEREIQSLQEQHAKHRREVESQFSDLKERHEREKKKLQDTHAEYSKELRDNLYGEAHAELHAKLKKSLTEQIRDEHSEELEVLKRSAEEARRERAELRESHSKVSGVISELLF